MEEHGPPDLADPKHGVPRLQEVRLQPNGACRHELWMHPFTRHCAAACSSAAAAACRLPLPRSELVVGTPPPLLLPPAAVECGAG